MAEKGFQEADLVVENRFSVPRIQHCPLETDRADAWVEPDETLVVRTSTQGYSRTPQALADLFGLPVSKVRVLAPYVGGAFGARLGSWTSLEVIASLLAMKSGRMVRLVSTREEQFIDSRHRPAIIIYIKDGVKRDGTLLARQMRVVVDAGRHSHMSMVVVRNSSFGAVGTYRIPNFKLDSYGVYTNNPLCGPYRGVGTPELTWAIEQQMNIMAERLGVDPVEIRKKNILREGEKDVCGQTTHSIGVRECLEKIAQWIDWGKKPRDGEGSWRIGKGIAIGNKYTMGATSSVAIAKVHPDGTIEIRHGNDEIGQGINTVVAQIAAEEFGVSVDKVRVVRGDTAFCPYDFGAVSSRSAFHTGNAVQRACQDAKRQIFDMAAGKLGVNVADLEIRKGKVYVRGVSGNYVAISDLFSYDGVPLEGGEVLGTGTYRGSIILENPETGQSDKMVMYYSHAAAAVEVAVNVETGEVKILRIGGAYDMGTAINPKMAEAQMEGGLVQGIGSALLEKLVIDKGVVCNPSFMDYKIPCSTDVPANENLKAIIVEVPHSEGPFGAKGLGELTRVPVAPAIANAVHGAIGVRVKDSPISREKILDGIYAQKGLKFD